MKNSVMLVRVALLVAALLVTGCYPSQPDDATPRKLGAAAPVRTPVAQLASPEGGATGGRHDLCAVDGGVTHWCDATAGGGGFIPDGTATSIRGVGRAGVMHDGGAYVVSVDASGLGGIQAIYGQAPIGIEQADAARLVVINPGTSGQVLKTINDAAVWQSGDGGAVRQVLGVGRVTATTDGGLVNVSVDAHGIGSFDAGAYVNTSVGSTSPENADLQCSSATSCTVTQLQGGEVTCGASTGTLTCTKGASACGMTQAAKTTDVASTPTTIQAQAAYASASTNRTGASLALASGAGSTSNGTPGNITLTVPAPSGTGTHGFVQMIDGTVPMWTFASDGSIFSLWMGDESQPYHRVLYGVNNAYTYLSAYNAVGLLVDNEIIVYSQLTATTFTSQSNVGLGGNDGPYIYYGGGQGVIGMQKAPTNPTACDSHGAIIWADNSSGSLTACSGTLFKQVLDNGVQVASTTGATTDANVSAQGTSSASYAGATAWLNGGANSGTSTTGASIGAGGATITLAGAGISLNTTLGTGSGTYYGLIKPNSLFSWSTAAVTCGGASTVLSTDQSRATVVTASGGSDAGTCGMRSLVGAADKGVVIVVNSGAHPVSFAWSTGQAVTVNSGCSTLVGSNGTDAIALLKGACS